MNLGKINERAAFIDTETMEYALLPKGDLHFLDADGVGYVGAIDEAGSMVKLEWLEIPDDAEVEVESFSRHDDSRHQHCTIEATIVHVA